MIHPAAAKDQADAILLTVTNVCLQLDIPYFLIAGTCLGLYRDGAYIPDDHDIDIAIIYSPDNLDRVIHDLLMWGFQTDVGSDHENNHWWKWDILTDITWMIQQGFYETHDVIQYNNHDYHTPYPVEEYLTWKYGLLWDVPVKRGEYAFQHE